MASRASLCGGAGGRCGQTRSRGGLLLRRAESCEPEGCLSLSLDSPSPDPEPTP